MLQQAKTNLKTNKVIMYLFNRHIDDFKVGMKAKIGNKELIVTKNTGERVYFGKRFRNWLKLTDVGLYYA